MRFQYLQPTKNLIALRVIVNSCKLMRTDFIHKLMVKQNTKNSNLYNNFLTNSWNTRLESKKISYLNYSQTIDFNRIIANKIYSIFSKEFSLTQTCKIDYISFTTQLPKIIFKELLNYIAISINTLYVKNLFISISNGNKPCKTGDKGKYYKNQIQFSKSYIVSYTYQEDTKNYDIHVSIRGTELSKLNIFQQQALVRKLASFKLYFTRLDVCIDDKTYKLIPLNHMINAYYKGNYCYFKKYYCYKNTHYFGSRASNKVMRIYPKKDFIRLETEFRDKYANDIFYIIKNLTTIEFQAILAAIAVGVIDFRDKSKLKNPNKAYAGNTKRLPFWHNFIANKLGIESKRL